MHVPLQAAYLHISPEYRLGAIALLRTMQEAADGQQAELKSRIKACMPTPS